MEERDQDLEMETDPNCIGGALLSELGLQKITPLIPTGMPGPANINIEELGLRFEKDSSIPENIEAPESTQPSPPESAKLKDFSGINIEKEINEHEDIVVESDLGCFFTDSEIDLDKPPKTPGGDVRPEEVDSDQTDPLDIEEPKIQIDPLSMDGDSESDPLFVDKPEENTESGSTSNPLIDKIQFLDEELGWNENDHSFGTKMKTESPEEPIAGFAEDGFGPYKCLVCFKVYMNFKKFTTHTTPNCPTLNSHGCEVCGQVFATQRKLKDHAIDHNPAERYSCPICGKVIKYKYHIGEHMKTHREERPFTCQHCDKAFKFKNHLKRHEALHSGFREGEGSFPCDFCDKVFRAKACLRRHQFVHGVITDGTNFPCHFCGKGFSCKRDLENHINMHTGERPFPCQQCDKKFTAKKYLLQHNKSVHCGVKRK